MNIPQANEKLTRAVRSLYRYAILLAGNFPDILINQEEKILTESFQVLNASEILYIVGAWPELVKAQTIEQELENKQLETGQIKKDIKSLN